jgi:potassium voltage-gated channel Eag-related subfamily H protein 8
MLTNRLLKEAIFPNIWKISKIIPLHKSENIKDMNNYRTISILPIMSKILENLIHKHLMKFLTIHNLLSDKQFIF